MDTTCKLSLPFNIFYQVQVMQTLCAVQHILPGSGLYACTHVLPPSDPRPLFTEGKANLFGTSHRILEGDGTPIDRHTPDRQTHTLLVENITNTNRLYKLCTSKGVRWTYLHFDASSPHPLLAPVVSEVVEKFPPPFHVSVFCAGQAPILMVVEALGGGNGAAMFVDRSVVLAKPLVC